MVGVYPSPAGATESELPLGAWDAVLAAAPALATLAPDVEAALVRARGSRVEAYLVPIDVCYELVGAAAQALARVRRRARTCAGRRWTLFFDAGGGAVPVTELAFTVLDAAPERYAAAPTLLFRVRLTESTGAIVHAIALRAQVQIEPQRRQYAEREQEGLADLFGPPDRWSQTLRPFLWTHAVALVPGFTGAVEFDLPVACTYDFEVAAAKYLHALGDGEVPLRLLFSGTVFTRGEHRLRGRAGALAPGGGVPAAGRGSGAR